MYSQDMNNSKKHALKYNQDKHNYNQEYSAKETQDL